MAIKFNRSQTFATNGTVTAPSLHNLVDGLDIYQSLITDQTNVTSVSTADELLIAIAAGSEGDAPKAVTVQELFQDALTAGTYTNANISETLSYGTATGTRLVSANATITTGTITTGVIPTLTSSTATFGTTTSTAATITSGTITNLASTTGTIATLNSTTGTIATLVASAGTFAGSLVNVTTGTIATLNSTTGTISNLSTTLAGDFTISQGTGTLGTTGITAGTYGTNTQAVSLTVDAKGRITTISTSAIATITSGTAVASTSGTAIDFTGIPSYVKQIFVMFRKVSVDGTSSLLLQLGDSGGIEDTNYDGMSGVTGTSGANANINITNGIPLLFPTMSAASEYSGNLRILNIDQNKWTIDGIIYASSLNYINYFAGTKETSGTLDRIRITTSGTNTFDLGLINIMYQ